MLEPEVRAFVQQQVRERFDRYARVFTTSDEDAGTRPSTERQIDLLRMLEAECRALELADVVMDGRFLYATLPARAGCEGAEAFGLMAHVDTSPEQPGEHVVPVWHEGWDGSPIRFADDPELVLAIEDSAELADHVGDTIVTASGQTLLGADDKAGLAEIMAAVAALRRFDLPHGEVRLIFTTDEEIGYGVEGIDLARLPVGNYTIDGGKVGGLQYECFDAWGVTVGFDGVGVHPGTAKGKLINAGTAMARFVAALPAEETPERTEQREGFYYVATMTGGCERAECRLIVRDFEPAENQRRIGVLRELAQAMQAETPGLKVTVDVRHQYPNMREGILKHPQVLERARAAIRAVGLEPHETPIRGGTDGSQLADQGHPTPNIFTGGHLGHSRREWATLEGMTQAALVCVELARLWGGDRTEGD